MFRFLLAALAAFLFAVSPAFAGGSRHHADDVKIQTFAENDPTFTANPTFRTPRMVASAIAPNLAAGGCMGSSAAGGQGMTFGLSFGTTWQSEKCNMRADAWHLYEMNLHGAAWMRMCMDDDVALAMKYAGTPCPEGLRQEVLARRNHDVNTDAE